MDAYVEPYGSVLFCIVYGIVIRIVYVIVVSDAPVANCVIYTDKMIKEMVDKIGDGDDAEMYGEVLSLITEEVDAEKLKEAAAKRAQKQLQLPTPKESTKGKGKNKKKGI